MAFVSKFTGPEIDRRLAQGTYDDAVAAGFTGTKEQFDAWIAAYTPAEMEKLNNKQDKEDPMLETENKTVVGAINLLNSEKQDKEDERLATESKIVVDAINELNTRATDLYYNKQDKEDSGLVTEQKTIVGAINEVRLKLQDQDSQKQDKVDNGFATNDKSVVGAVNEIHNELDTCVADYNEHIDEYEVFKANTENTLNSHSTQIGQLTQEKQDKTDFNLATKSKTVVDAINENHASITAEVARSVAEDARLDETKVSYTDISDDTNPDRKTIMLKNHDSLSGYGTDGTTAYNLAMVSKWDKADFGAAGIPINLNGSEAHPTYNDKEELAFVSELSGETGKLAEDIKSLNETVATVKQDLADSVSSINKNMEDGFNTINDDIDNEIRPAIEKNTKDIGVVNNTLTTKINETEEKLQADINYLKPRVTTLESLQIVKVDSDSETYAASYELQDATGKVYGQRINIATDKFIKSVSYANQVLTIVFVLEDGSEYSQNIDVSELMNVYTAGGGITISDTGVVSVSDETLQMIQYSDSEVRRLEKDKIPYAYDEKTQSNINVILPEGGSYLGNYGDENATIAKAAVYDGIKQLEIGSSKVHTNINTDSDVTIETSDGKKVIATTDQIPDVFETKGLTELETGESSANIEAALGIDFTSLIEIIRENKTVIVDRNSAGDYKACIHASGNISSGNGAANLMFFIGTTPTIYQVQYVSGIWALAVDKYEFADKDEIPDISNLATKSEVNAKQDTLVSGTNIKTLNGESLLGEGNIQLDEGPIDYETLTNKPSINSVELSGNLSFEDLGLDVNPTWEQIQNKPTFATVATSGDYNDLTDTPDLTVYQPITDNSLATSAKTISAAINEIKESVDSISDPYEINLTNLLSAEDSESISTAIGGIDNLNATVQNNRIIVGTISNGNVSVSIRILGNVTTLYYLLDSVVGLTLNEVAITNTSGTLSKSVTTHSVLTENMVINSLESDETTLPLSAAQGKILATDKQDKTDNNLDTTDKTIVGAINEILPKATGVGKVDPNSDGTGEIFNNHSVFGGNVAPGSYSHAECHNTKAIGNYSHAEGDTVSALGESSHAEGFMTTAHSICSHAEGRYTSAVGEASHAEGYDTQTFSSNEHAEGRCNKSYNNSTNPSVSVVHSVGIGASNQERKNAHEIKFNGDHYVYGVGGYDGTNAIEDTSKTLQEVINSKQATITAGTGLEFEGTTLNVTLDTTVFKVVSVLPDSPAQGDENKIHLVPAESTGANNSYTEYVWVNSAWEILGEYTSEVDLTPYLKSTDAAATYLSKTDATSTYLNKTDASSTYLSKTDAASTYETVSHASSTYATATNLNSAVSRITTLENKQTVVTEVPTLTAAYTIPANATMVEKIYMITIGATAYDVTGATGIKWAGGVAPTASANSILVVSVLNNLATWQTFI